MLKIIGVNGSPRKAATLHAVSVALEAAKDIPGVEVETELLDLSGKKISPCIHCNRCIREGNGVCPTFDDDMNQFYAPLKEADGIILGSPVYQMGPTATMAIFANRWRCLGGLATNGHWGSRVGASIAVGGTRNGGQETTLVALNNILLCMGFNVTCGGIFAYGGASVWSNDKKAAGVEADTVGMDSLRMVGRRTAVIAQLLKTGREVCNLDGVVIAGFRDKAALDEKISKFTSREEKS